MNVTKILSFILLVLFFSQCIDSTSSRNEIQLYSKEQLQGQWSLIRIDTIPEKQSLKLNKQYNNIAVEYSRPYIKPVNGVLQLVSDDEGFYNNDIEFFADTIFEYGFPYFLNGQDQFHLDSNKIIFQEVGIGPYFNPYWASVSPPLVKLNSNNDTLYITYLEKTGLYLSEAYTKSNFPDTLTRFLKAYETYLPAAKGNYSLVQSLDISIDYDSPFEYTYNFPHKISKNINLSHEALVNIAQNDFVYRMKTDGKERAYKIYWDNRTIFGDSLICLTPDREWYPDSYEQIFYKRIKVD